MSENSAASYDIEVLTKPGCQPCKATKRFLEKRGIYYDEIDLTKNPDALADAQADGHTAAPVVYVLNDEGDVADAWAGYRPDKLKAWASIIFDETEPDHADCD